MQRKNVGSMHTKTEEPDTAELYNHFKTTSDVLFTYIPSGFSNDILAISDC